MKAILKFCTISILMLYCCTHQLQAQKVKSSLPIGKVAEVKAAFDAKANVGSSRASDGRIVQNLPNQASIVLQLTSSKQKEGTNLYFGKVENAGNSHFYLELSGNTATGAIILLDQRKYFRYTSAAEGTVNLVEEDIDKVLCVNYALGPTDSKPSSGRGGVVAAAIPNLQSFPGAEAVVYLDFDGQTVSGTLWNSQFTTNEPIVAAPANLSDAEMVEVWELMSEDFRPFNLNVTTSEAVFNNAPVNKRMRVIFTPTNYFYQNAGGAAYVGSFTWGGTTDGETPAFVWNEGIKGAGEAGSHEVGHTLNLAHDGRTNPQEEYYAGHGDWAPIMGVSYSKLVAQWSKGEYPNASNTEDDLSKITTMNGFGYRSDDHGNSTGAATPLVFDADGRVSPLDNKGVISTRSDVDVFSFKSEGGAISLTISPDLEYPNLDVLVTLRNAAGTVMTTADPSTVEAHIDVVLEAGTYYLTIDGTKGALGANSDYASLGAYTISTKDYCVPVYTDGCNTYATLIDNFSFHTLVNNNSGCGNGTFKGYTNYSPSGNFTTSVSPGQSYNMSMQSGPANGQYFGVWIDYNGDKDFDDDGEFVYASPNRSTGAFTTSITIPANVTPGAKRMRIRSNWDPLITGAHSCTAMTWGEAEDYTITIVGNQAPVVSLTSPSEGASYTSPATVELAASASDSDGTIAKVEFFHGTTKIGEDATAPYTYSWTGVVAGSYALTARATDDDGASTTSSVVNITVRDSKNQAPVISLTTPKDGAKFTSSPKPIRITAVASDADGKVVKVEFFSGETKLGEDKKAPYFIIWRQMQPGKYTLTARATDNKGAVTISKAVTIEIVESSRNKPLAASILPSSESPFEQVIVYPNPVAGRGPVNIKLPGYYETVGLKIHEISTGKILLEHDYESINLLQVDVSKLTRGIYSLTIKAEGYVWIRKLVVL